MQVVQDTGENRFALGLTTTMPVCALTSRTASVTSAPAPASARAVSTPIPRRLELRYEKPAVVGTEMVPVVYHAQPGSPSARALAALMT
jgi:hypothetical protein